MSGRVVLAGLVSELSAADVSSAVLRSLVNQSALSDSERLPIPENGHAEERLVNNVFFIYFNLFCIYVVVLNMQGMVFP